MKFILTALGVFIASLGITSVTVTQAEASCKFPSRIECEGPTNPTPPPSPDDNCKFPSRVECEGTPVHLDPPTHTPAPNPPITLPMDGDSWSPPANDCPPKKGKKHKKKRGVYVLHR